MIVIKKYIPGGKSRPGEGEEEMKQKNSRQAAVLSSSSWSLLAGLLWAARDNMIQSKPMEKSFTDKLVDQLRESALL